MLECSLLCDVARCGLGPTWSGQTWFCWLNDSSQCFWSWIKLDMERHTLSIVHRFTLAKVIHNIQKDSVVYSLLIWPSYTRLPGQETTVNATRLRCSFNMGTKAE